MVPKKMRFYGLRDIEKIPQLEKLSHQQIFELKTIAQVLPFRTNNYVVEELIDWDNIPNDPIYQLTFLQKDMLEPQHYDKIAKVMNSGATKDKIRSAANEIRYELNPHPAGQMTANIPIDDDEIIPGVQHKYRETALIFPSAGQTCHAYCTFCFRWAQFVGIDDLKFATDESKRFQNYIKKQKQITDILLTGGDPMVMSIKKLEAYILPFLQPEFNHIRSIRIGTKSLAYWPYRYVTDKDADDILRLFEKVIKSGKHLAIMAHFNHWVEMTTPIVHKAIRRLRNVGIEIRTQSPVIKHINNDSSVWKRMWKDQVNLGLIPYYMFVERNTGAKHYFEVPLAECLNIYRDAYKEVSGLARTVRGPSMSANPGKVSIEGTAEINGEKVFVLNFLQARNPDWVKKPFFAKYDTKAGWLTQLKPAFGNSKFFFEEELKQIIEEKTRLFELRRELSSTTGNAV
ncbi:MAG: lysine 2,3-aminomutase [Melioribacteraceae bacterium]|nr:lysine 2,3-aminomutase [Melioribacteraceae bacterium]